MVDIFALVANVIVFLFLFWNVGNIYILVRYALLSISQEEHLVPPLRLETVILAVLGIIIGIMSQSNIWSHCVSMAIASLILLIGACVVYDAVYENEF